MLDPQPLVTIAIPTFNRANKYLPLALKSAVNQDYANLEIIVSDNASTDGTEAVVASLKSPRVRYIKHERNIGSNKNCNYCVAQAAGVYFLLLHDDDLIDPDFVTSCIEAAAGQKELGVIRTGIRVINSNGDTLREKKNPTEGLSLSEFFRAWFRGDTAFYLANTLYNTRALQESKGFSTSQFDDVCSLVSLAAAHGRADVHEIKASFRRHESNAGGNPDLVMAWARDSVELRDLLVRLTPIEDRELIQYRSNQVPLPFGLESSPQPRRPHCALEGGIPDLFHVRLPYFPPAVPQRSWTLRIARHAPNPATSSERPPGIAYGLNPHAHRLFRQGFPEAFRNVHS